MILELQHIVIPRMSSCSSNSITVLATHLLVVSAHTGFRLAVINRTRRPALKQLSSSTRFITLQSLGCRWLISWLASNSICWCWGICMAASPHWLRFLLTCCNFYWKLKITGMLWHQLITYHRVLSSVHSRSLWRQRQSKIQIRIRTCTCIHVHETDGLCSWLANICPVLQYSLNCK